MSRKNKGHTHVPILEARKKLVEGDDFIGCSIKYLPEDQAVEAARRAIEFNPVNRPQVERLSALDFTPTPDHLAVMTTKYWGTGGVKLTVGFMDGAPADLQKRILLHMNAWGAFSNVTFTLTTVDPQVRIARQNSGYWSYLGTDVLGIPRNQQTMNLQGFTMNTPDSEFYRVVRHETGHTLGFPHEHMRREIVALLDEAKTLAYFQRTQGWSAQQVRQQVLTALEDRSIQQRTEIADTSSIMTYQLPGSITKNGQPIPGGNDIDELDKKFAALIYPLSISPPPPPDGGDSIMLTLSKPLEAGSYVVSRKGNVLEANEVIAESVQAAERAQAGLGGLLIKAVLANIPWGQIQTLLVSYVGDELRKKIEELIKKKLGGN